MFVCFQRETLGNLFLITYSSYYVAMTLMELHFKYFWKNYFGMALEYNINVPKFSFFMYILLDILCTALIKAKC